jgi:hypothetical protein
MDPALQLPLDPPTIDGKIGIVSREKGPPGEVPIGTKLLKSSLALGSTLPRNLVNTDTPA